VPAERRLRRAVTRSRKADAAQAEARAELRAAIKEAREADMTLDHITAIVGVSRQRILQLLEKG
jgi:transcriptional/translational regulatory protein YebC/TACO1